MRVKISKDGKTFIHGNCALCGSGAGTMKVQEYKTGRTTMYVCMPHLSMLKDKDSKATKKSLKDGDWFTSWFTNINSN